MQQLLGGRHGGRIQERVMIKRLLTIAAIAWAVWYLTYQPEQAAALIHHGTSVLHGVAASAARFVNGL
jgi:hypothetical protein